MEWDKHDSNSKLNYTEGKQAPPQIHALSPGATAGAAGKQAGSLPHPSKTPRFPHLIEQNGSFK